MNIYMTGIDFDRAAICDREVFSFTKIGAKRAVEEALQISGADGCVLLSTCNRTELWLSGQVLLSPYHTLCRLKGADPSRVEPLFKNRSGEQAVRHLFALACGMKSQVFGEDQIISQVKNAAALSREAGCMDTVLEKLFQTAVTASKRIKSEVFLTSSHPCVATKTIELLKKQLGDLDRVPCLVIGSGEMGKLTARLLLEEGCSVTITQRRLHSEPAKMPKGCQVIPYDQRLSALSRVQAVISATLSPHYTLKKEEAAPFLPKHRCIFVDLAVPRDIDPAIGELEFAECFDMDSFDHSPAQAYQNQELAKAQLILREYQEQLIRWYYFRDYLPNVESIADSVAQDVAFRINRSMSRLPLDQRQQSELERQTEDAAKKSVRKLLFSLRNTLNLSQWNACFSAMCGKDAQPNRQELWSAAEGGSGSDFFPLFVSLRGKTVRIVGGGAIALRRIRTLLPFGCRVELVSPQACPALVHLAKQRQINWTQRQYQPGDCKEADLVCACTDNRQINHLVAEECRRLSIPVSVADCKEECTFLFPAVIAENGTVIGISSGGSDHRLVRRTAQRIRERRESIFFSEGGNADESGD